MHGWLAFFGLQQEPRNWPFNMVKPAHDGSGFDAERDAVRSGERVHAHGMQHRGTQTHTLRGTSCASAAPMRTAVVSTAPKVVLARRNHRAPLQKQLRRHQRARHYAATRPVARRHAAQNHHAWWLVARHHVLQESPPSFPQRGRRRRRLCHHQQRPGPASTNRRHATRRHQLHLERKGIGGWSSGDRSQGT